MKNKSLLILIICSTAAAFIILIYFATLPKNSNKTGFKRKFKSYILEKKAELHSLEITEIIGYHNNEFFFATKSPDHIIKTDSKLQNSKDLFLKIQVTPRLKSNFRFLIKDSQFYILGSNMPSIARYDPVTNLRKETAFLRPFSQGVVVSKDNYIIRGFDTDYKNEVFFKVSGDKIIRERDITVLSNDGGYSSDGLLHFDKKNDLVIYHHFYTNHLFALDTNLNLIYKTSTIDTNKTFKTKGVLSQSSYTLSSPPIAVNKTSCEYNGTLYINSMIVAENENPDISKKNAIIDMYDLKTGNYQGSFYIPLIKNSKVKQLAIDDSLLIVRHTNSIILYNLRK